MSQISSARTYRSGVPAGGAPAPAPQGRRRRWSLSRTVAAATVLVLLAVAGTGAFLYFAASHLADEARLQQRDLEPASTRAVTLLVDYIDEQDGVQGYLLTGGAPASLGPLERARQDIPGLQAALSREVAAVPGAPAALAQVEADHADWERAYADPEVALVRGGQLAEARSIAHIDFGAALFSEIGGSFAPLQGTIAGQREANDSHIRHVEDELVLILIAALSVLALLVASAGYLTIQHITLPVADLTEQLVDGRRRRLRRGSRAITRLGDYAEAVRSELVAETERSRQATESLRLQSPTVAALVDALAPRLDPVAGVTTATRLDPAEGLLAGDWYDLLDVGPGRVAVAVGDVAGHGPVSAVLALRMREILTASLLDGDSPSTALRRTARGNERGSPELFATVFVAVFDVAASHLTYANAGHPPGLLHPGGPGPVVELAPTGPLVSPMLADARWDDLRLPLGPGAGLLVVTDGAIEGRDRAGEEFGTERLAALLDRLRGASPSEVVDALAADIDDFVGHRRADDRTLLYCRQDRR